MQPDLSDINCYYRQSGGEFWVALSGGKLIGTVGLMLKENKCAVMKKFFVKKEFRSKKVGLTLYKKLLEFALNADVKHISYWIRLPLPKHLTDFMKNPDFAE